MADVLKKLVSLGLVFCLVSKMESILLLYRIIKTIKQNNPNKFLAMKQISEIVSSLFKLFSFANGMSNHQSA